MRSPSPATVLSIAGSDCGGGAGIQADLKTFLDHGVYGMAVITAVTAQNTRRVSRVEVLEAELVRAQLRAVLDDLPVDAVKIGMLGSEAVVRVLVEELADLSAPIVLDPVLVSSSGRSLLDEPEALKDLVPLCALVTPNLPELEALGGMPWAESCGVPVLVTGGHDPGDTVHDCLVGTTSWSHRRIRTRNTHGTGCTLSSAIAARLAKGEKLVDAIGGALSYLEGLLEGSAEHTLGTGHGPLLHGLTQT